MSRELRIHFRDSWGFCFCRQDTPKLVVQEDPDDFWMESKTSTKKLRSVTCRKCLAILAKRVTLAKDAPAGVIADLMEERNLK